MKSRSIIACFSLVIFSLNAAADPVVGTANRLTSYQITNTTEGFLIERCERGGCEKVDLLSPERARQIRKSILLEKTAVPAAKDETETWVPYELIGTGLGGLSAWIVLRAMPQMLASVKREVAGRSYYVRNQNFGAPLRFIGTFGTLMTLGYYAGRFANDRRVAHIMKHRRYEMLVAFDELIDSLSQTIPMGQAKVIEVPKWIEAEFNSAPLPGQIRSEIVPSHS